MIVVFVVDTSPSMGKSLNGGSSADSRTAANGMSRLDLAKMTVEDVVRGLNRRVAEHNLPLQQQPDLQKSLRNIGLGFSPNDEFLLLSTGLQHPQQPATAACGAGGRLLIGYGDHNDQTADNSNDQPGPHPSNANSFQRELKRLQATDWEPGKAKAGLQSNKPVPFPEDGGGAVGLNAALSAGLQLLSRYRLSDRSTENYGMGRLPSSAVLNPSGGGAAMHALQPACLILITDGACLRSSPAEGGGSLQLQYGNLPLREFYQEPFRWDQRIFCLGVGGRDGVQSTQYLHPHLRALCEVTGGSHLMLRSSASLSQVTGFLLNQIAPPRPKDFPIPEPISVTNLVYS
jgi:integrator complex subunit 6